MSILESHQALLTSLGARTAVAMRTWAPGAKVTDLRPLTGGASSLTFVATLDGAPGGHDSVVLKVAPPGLPPVRNRDVLRQARLMAALAGKPGVLVPTVLFEDAGNPPDVPPFLAMSMVTGDCVEPVLADRGAVPPEQVRARSLDAVRMLADLHNVDALRTPLAAEPVVTLGAEIDRWTRAFTTIPAELCPDYAPVAALLHATMPAALPPVVNHGDYRLGNTLCEGDAVNAIIDWEIWSLGDPRVDMTWLTFFTDEARHPASPSDEPTGTPSKAELLSVYEKTRGAELTDLPWFEALTKYKESAATALLIKRARKGGETHNSFDRMLPALVTMLDEAVVLIRD